MEKYLFELYVTGQTPQSQRAIKNLTDICQSEMSGGYRIDVVDILKDPALAEQEKIIATPTVIRQTPKPVKMVIGDLSNRLDVIYGLEIIAKEI